MRSDTVPSDKPSANTDPAIDGDIARENDVVVGPVEKKPDARAAAGCADIVQGRECLLDVLGFRGGVDASEASGDVADRDTRGDCEGECYDCSTCSFRLESHQRSPLGIYTRCTADTQKCVSGGRRPKVSAP